MRRTNGTAASVRFAHDTCASLLVSHIAHSPPPIPKPPSMSGPCSASASAASVTGSSAPEGRWETVTVRGRKYEGDTMRETARGRWSGAFERRTERRPRSRNSGCRCRFRGCRRSSMSPTLYALLAVLVDGNTCERAQRSSQHTIAERCSATGQICKRAHHSADPRGTGSAAWPNDCNVRTNVVSHRTDAARMLARRARHTAQEAVQMQRRIVETRIETRPRRLIIIWTRVS
jgi:hypothetical protein